MNYEFHLRSGRVDNFTSEVKRRGLNYICGDYHRTRDHRPGKVQQQRYASVASVVEGRGGRAQPERGRSKSGRNAAIGKGRDYPPRRAGGIQGRGEIARIVAGHRDSDGDGVARSVV